MNREKGKIILIGEEQTHKPLTTNNSLLSIENKSYGVINNIRSAYSEKDYQKVLRECRKLRKLTEVQKLLCEQQEDDHVPIYFFDSIYLIGRKTLFPIVTAYFIQIKALTDLGDVRKCLIN